MVVQLERARLNGSQARADNRVKRERGKIVFTGNRRECNPRSSERKRVLPLCSTLFSPQVRTKKKRKNGLMARRERGREEGGRPILRRCTYTVAARALLPLHRAACRPRAINPNLTEEKRLLFFALSLSTTYNYALISAGVSGHC